MEQTSSHHYRATRGANRYVAGHRAALGASAAAIAIIAAVSTVSVLGPSASVNAAESGNLSAPPVAASAEDPLRQLPSFAGLVDRVKPAVVSIYVKATPEPGLVSSVPDDSQDDDAQPNSQNSPFDFFKQFGTPQPGGPDTKGRPQAIVHAEGSGFFISSDGYVVTNNHVVDHAKSLEIKTTDGDTYKAEIVGVDPKTDIALLKVKGRTDFPYVAFAATSPRIGDWVLAMGNPFGLGGTVTAGIVSASGRDIGSGPYDDYIQIDAPVNKGNSGGPTFNLKGEVVGVNTAIYSPSGGSVGIAFDIPSQTVKAITDQLRSKGSITRGWMGVSIQPVTRDIADSLRLKDATGALIDEPKDGSPAQKAGLKSEDVVVAVNGSPIRDARALARKIADYAPGTNVKLTVMRRGKQQMMDVALAPYPDDKTVADNNATGEVEPKLGLTLAPAAEVAGAGSNGVVVTNVDPDGAAADKGVQQGDVILEVGGNSVSSPRDVKSALEAASKEGDRAILMRIKTAQGARFVAVPIG
jgi:serine protease Do